MSAPAVDQSPPDARPLWLSVMGLLGVFVLLLVIGYRAAPAALDGFKTVEVQVRAKAGAESPALSLLALAERATDRRHPLPPGHHWLLEKRPVTALGLVLPASWRQWLDAVEVRIGARSWRYAAADLVERWQRGIPRSGDGGSEVWWAPAAELATLGIVARRTTALNGPDDAEVLPRLLAFPALLLLSLAALMAFRCGWAGALAAGAPSPAPDEGPGAALSGRTWLAFGVGAVVSALILAERIEPYYFTQGDNLTRLLPIALDGCARLNHDAWPDFDPYQMLGMPMASAGVHALSYPLLWLSCAVSDGVPGLRTALYEFYGAVHLVLGFLAAVWLGRREGLSPALATAFGLSFALAGVFLIAGRSWAHMLPAATWLPLLLLSARSLETTLRPFRWVLASGLAIGLFCHAGNRELWFFGLLAWALTIAVGRAGAGLSRQRLGWALAALLLGLAVAMPLLVAKLRLYDGLAPQPASAHGIWHGLAALALPYPLVDVGDPEGWGAAASGSMSQLYYSGTLLTLAGAIATAAALAAWLRGARGGGYWRRQRWSLLAVLAFLLCLGGPGFLWPLFGLLSLLQRDAYPFELLALLVLALNLNGALALQRLLPGRGSWHAAAALSVALLMLLHVGLARQSFGRYADDPYPALPAAVAAVLQPTEADLLGPRLVALAPGDDPRPGFTAALPGNLATYYRLLTPDGDDMATQGSAERRRALELLSARPQQLLRAFGVRWALLYRPTRGDDEALTPNMNAPSAFAAQAAALLAALRPIATSEGLALYDLGPSDPIAFFADTPEAALPVRDAAGGITVALPDFTEARQVVLNFLLRPGLEVTAGGTSLPLHADGWGRTVVEVSAGSRELRLGYSFGWGRGLYYGIVLALAAMALLVLLLRFGPDDSRLETLA